MTEERVQTPRLLCRSFSFSHGNNLDVKEHNHKNQTISLQILANVYCLLGTFLALLSPCLYFIFIYRLIKFKKHVLSHRSTEEFKHEFVSLLSRATVLSSDLKCLSLHIYRPILWDRIPGKWERYCQDMSWHKSVLCSYYFQCSVWTLYKVLHKGDNLL